MTKKGLPGLDEVGKSLLQIRELRIGIDTGGIQVWPVRDATLNVSAGERVGLVGESGSGKTLTALSVMNLLPPLAFVAAGVMEVKGETVSAESLANLRGSSVAMVFQDPSSFLNPVMTVGRQLIEVIRAHTELDQDQATRRAISLLSEVRMPDPDAVLAKYPHQLSGGMKQRVVIAHALAGDPDLLIADEPTTALDVTVQAQIMRLLMDLATERGLGLLLITHNIALISRYCDSVYVMYAGEVMESGPVDEVLQAPHHPYTKALLAAMLEFDDFEAEFKPIRGAPPQLDNRPQGCQFHPRCPAAFEKCQLIDPPRIWLTQSRMSSCWLAETER